MYGVRVNLHLVVFTIVKRHHTVIQLPWRPRDIGHLSTHVCGHWRGPGWNWSLYRIIYELLRISFIWR